MDQQGYIGSECQSYAPTLTAPLSAPPLCAFIVFSGPDEACDMAKMVVVGTTQLALVQLFKNLLVTS